jgi:ribosome-associated protein
MDIKQLQSLVIDALEDVKAQDIRVYDTMHLTSMFDRIAIASGTSNRQTKALAASVRDKFKAAGGTDVKMEGEGTGEWVLVDLGDMVVHIMQPAIRAYYRLEEIWGDKEVKLGAAKRGIGRAPAQPAAAKKPVAKKAAAKKAPAKKAPTKTASKIATKTASKKAAKPVRKTATKTAAKKVATKAPAKTAAKKAAPRRTATKG